MKKMPGLVLDIYGVIFEILTFASQATLYVILWNLGTKREEPADDESDEGESRTEIVSMLDEDRAESAASLNEEQDQPKIVSVRLTSWDEEAEV